MRAPRPVVAIVAALVATACSGPRPPLLVGVKHVPSNVQFGSPPPHVVAPPIPPVALTVPEPLFLSSPPAPPPPGARTTTTAAPTTLAPPTACATASRIAAVAEHATTTITRPPAASTYTYRAVGSYETSGANPQKGTYPTNQTRAVSDVKANGEAFTYTVTSILGSAVTATTYSYTPPSDNVPAAAGTLPTAGLYITKVVTRVAGQQPTTFAPAPPGLLLLAVPAAAANSWHATATDPSTATTMSFTATQGKNEVVDACGTVVDSVRVHLDGKLAVSQNPGGTSPTTVGPIADPGGRQVSPTSTLTFSADYAIATQYGGLSVMDTVETNGTENGVGVVRRLTSTINQVPKAQ